MLIEQLKNNYKIGDGIFVLTDNEIKKLSLNENEKKRLLSLLTAKQN